MWSIFDFAARSERSDVTEKIYTYLVHCSLCSITVIWWKLPSGDGYTLRLRS